MFFTADEAATIEAAVDRLIPPDSRGPGGKDAGCAVFIDRQLAGPYGRAEGLYTRPPFMPGAATQGYQLPGSPAARYRTGLRALADYIKSNFTGKSFNNLAPGDQDTVLKGLESGAIVLKDVKSAEFFALLLANTQEGFFADPIYGGNRDMASWKLIGFPARVTIIANGLASQRGLSLPPVGIMGRSDGRGEYDGPQTPRQDVVIIGFGWTGSILATNCKAGLNVVAIERGPWRDTATDFHPPMRRTNFATRAARSVFASRPANADDSQQSEPNGAADPQLFRLPSGQRRRRGRDPLERTDLALSADGFQLRSHLEERYGKDALAR